jgi:hypothetical protein
LKLQLEPTRVGKFAFEQDFLPFARARPASLRGEGLGGGPDQECCREDPQKFQSHGFSHLPSNKDLWGPVFSLGTPPEHRQLHVGGSHLNVVQTVCRMILFFTGKNIAFSPIFRCPTTRGAPRRSRSVKFFSNPEGKERILSEREWYLEIKGPRFPSA